MKPFIFNKSLSPNNIIFAENNEMVLEEEIITNIMNNCFTNITTHHPKDKLTKIDPRANLESIINTF